eukprot:2780017-Prymnesium_polylepis.1
MRRLATQFAARFLEEAKEADEEDYARPRCSNMDLCTEEGVCTVQLGDTRMRLDMTNLWCDVSCCPNGKLASIIVYWDGKRIAEFPASEVQAEEQKAGLGQEKRVKVFCEMGRGTRRRLTAYWVPTSAVM